MQHKVKEEKEAKVFYFWAAPALAVQLLNVALLLLLKLKLPPIALHLLITNHLLITFFSISCYFTVNFVSPFGVLEAKHYSLLEDNWMKITNR